MIPKLALGLLVATLAMATLAPAAEAQSHHRMMMRHHRHMMMRHRHMMMHRR